MLKRMITAVLALLLPLSAAMADPVALDSLQAVELLSGGDFLL